MRKNVSNRGRPSKAAEDIVDVTYPTKLSGNLLEALKARKEETGIPVTELIRQAIEQSFLPGEPTPDVAFKLNDQDKAELETLADVVLYNEDINAFAKTIVRAALDNGPEFTRKFIFGQMEAAAEELRKADEEQAEPVKTKSRKAA